MYSSTSDGFLPIVFATSSINSRIVKGPDFYITAEGGLGYSITGGGLISVTGDGLRFSATGGGLISATGGGLGFAATVGGDGGLIPATGGGGGGLISAGGGGG